MAKIKVKRYVEGDDGIIRSHKKYVDFTNESYTIYQNTIYKLGLLGKCEYLLYHFLGEKMNKSNTIYHSKKLRAEFIELISRICRINFKDSTVKKAFQKLVAVDLIIKYDNRGDFTMNPRHISKSTEKDREKLIQELVDTFEKKTTSKSNYRKALGLDNPYIKLK